PTAASVMHSGTFTFTGGNAILVNDPDSANETVTLAATAGTLTVTASGTTVTGNGSSSLTIVGTLGNVNTALGTLTYTAPATGASATLTAQANDGSASNNLSNVLTTTIAL